MRLSTPPDLRYFPSCFPLQCLLTPTAHGRADHGNVGVLVRWPPSIAHFISSRSGSKRRRWPWRRLPVGVGATDVGTGDARACLAHFGRCARTGQLGSLCGCCCYGDISCYFQRKVVSWRSHLIRAQRVLIVCLPNCRPFLNFRMSSLDDTM